MSDKGSGWQHGLNKTLSGLITIGDILLVLMQTLIVSFGAIVLMVLLLWVEQDAVSHGVATYETSPEKAAAAATVMVLFNFAVKFWEVYIESKATDQRKRFKPGVQYAFSLRTWFTGVQYFLGVGKKWKKEALPASAGFAQVRKIITIAMLYMAFVGRTHEAIQKVSLSNGRPLAWTDGLKMLAEKSSLSDITLWLTATIFTFAAVIAAQRLTQYVAVRVIEIRRGLDVQKTKRLSNRQSIGQGLDIQKTSNPAIGHSKTLDASAIVRRHLENNPDDLDATARDLAARLGVGHATANNVQREFRNGRSEEQIQ